MTLSSHRWWIVLAVGLAVSLPSFSYPHGRDQGTFALGGRMLREGKRPYVDFFDVKPPGIFYVYAGIQRLVGESPGGVRVVDALAQFGAALILLSLGRRLASASAGLYAAAAYLACYQGLGFWNTAQPESFIALLHVAFAWLVMWPDGERKDSEPLTGRVAERGEGLASHDALRSGAPSPAALLLAGALLGLGAWLKYTSVSIALLVLFVGGGRLTSHWPRKLLRMALLLAGTAAVIAAGCVIAAWQGWWGEFASVQSDFLPAYGAVTQASLLETLNNLLWIGLGGFQLPMWCQFSWLAACAAVAVDVRLRREMTLPLLALALAMLSVVVQGKYFTYHLIPALPWMSLLLGLLIHRLVGAAVTLSRTVGRQEPYRPAETTPYGMGTGVPEQTPPAARPPALHPARVEIATLVVLIGSFLPASALDWHGYVKGRLSGEAGLWDSRFQTSAYNAPALREAAAFLARTTPPERPVLVWAMDPDLYLQSGRRPRGRFIHNHPLRADYMPAAWKDEFQRSVITDPPSAIVVCQGDRMIEAVGNPLDSLQALQLYHPELVEWIQAHYVQVEVIGPYQILRIAGQ